MQTLDSIIYVAYNWHYGKESTRPGHYTPWTALIMWLDYDILVENLHTLDDAGPGQFQF